MTAPKTDRAAVAQALKVLVKDGYRLVLVDDGEEDTHVTTQAEALELIMDLDDATLVVSDDRGDGWIRFVMGNDPEEVICDYTTNLTVLDDLTEVWMSDTYGATGL